MIDDLEVMRQGESRPVFAIITAETGTITLQTSGTVCVVTPDNTLLLTDDPVTGYDAAAAASVRAWYYFEAVPASYPAGLYKVLFNIDGLGSDGETRTYCPEVGVRVDAAP